MKEKVIYIPIVFSKGKAKQERERERSEPQPGELRKGGKRKALAIAGASGFCFKFQHSMTALV